MRNNKRKWQRRFIKKIFESSDAKKKYFSKIILNNTKLIDEKNEYLPKYLFKYYSPTSENILDIKNQRLWLSHPNSFNDPFDCNIGYDQENYEKICLIKFIKEIVCVNENDKSEGFTVDDKNRILRSHLGDYYSMYNNIESYSDAIRKINETKSEEFQRKIRNILNEKTKQLVPCPENSTTTIGNFKYWYFIHITL